MIWKSLQVVATPYDDTHTHDTHTNWHEDDDTHPNSDTSSDDTHPN